MPNDARETNEQRPHKNKPRPDPAALLAAGLEASDGRGPSVEEMAEHFPQFDLLEVLGQGGMGIVYRARQKSLDRDVALKVLAPPPGDAAAFAERFGREARALAKLEHPNIVRVYDYGSSDDLHYLVMEFVDGITLRDAMHDGAMTPPEVLSIVPQICDALQAAHDQGIVHRDIKPENVLMGKDGSVKIADFGLAKIIDGEAASANTRLTRRDQVMGTLHYMAPEQFESPGDVDHRADLYSLGVVLYEMLTGELPIGRFDPPSERTTVDARLDGVVLRALAKQRDRRYQRATEFRSDMDVVAAGGDAPAALREAPQPATPRQWRTEPSRHSTVARCAIFAVPLAILVFASGGTIAAVQAGTLTLRDHLEIWAVSGFLATVVGIVGCAAGIIAAIQIRRSEGRLLGHRMAVTAVLLPLFAAPIIAPIAYAIATATSLPAHETLEMDKSGRHSGSPPPGWRSRHPTSMPQEEPLTDEREE